MRSKADLKWENTCRSKFLAYVENVLSVSTFLIIAHILFQQQLFIYVCSDYCIYWISIYYLHTKRSTYLVGCIQGCIMGAIGSCMDGIWPLFSMYICC